MSGIKYIDLKNINLTQNGNPVTIKGIFNTIKNTRKRVVLTNVKLDGTESNDVTGAVKVGMSSCVIVQAIDTGIRSFVISSNDTIKYVTKTWAQLNA